jgi:glycosyltransferase involved in cell wall biosynthesis
MKEKKRIALFLKSLEGGGMVTSMLRLARGIAERGHSVDVLVAAKPEEAIWEAAPDNATTVCLPRNALARLRLWQALRSYKRYGSENHKKPFIPIKMPRAPRYLPAVTDYMKRARPDGMIVAGTGYNLTALWARRLSGVQMPIVISERNSLQAEISLHENKGDWLWQHAPQLVAQAYPEADAIVANSYGVAMDLAETTGLPTSSMTTIFNPVVNAALQEKSRAPVDHPWFAPGMPPVILGAGRMHPQKDLQMLVKAFAKVRETREARLVILGEDAKHGVREELLTLAAALGVSDDLDLPGFVENPFAFMAKAGVFALSSRYEGCPNVLIEALACGCPVVSTRCPHGPDEILRDGEFGALVNVGDHAAMARALGASLDQSHDKRRLMERASDFGFDRAVDSYLSFL